MNKKIIVSDKEKCSGCNACVVICLEKHYDVEEIGVARREIKRYENEKNSTIEFYSLSCFHCTDCPCIEVCPTKAIKRDEETNMVIVEEDICIGCEKCKDICKYNIIKMENGKIVKCDGCVDRIKIGQEPLCVQTCQGKALKFLNYDEIELKNNINKYKDIEKIL